MDKQTAFIFPGQGSQSSGMLLPEWESNHIIASVFDEANTVLDFDLYDLINKDTASTLNKTQYAQPALLTLSVALWRVYQSKASILPTFLAGHSLGEYSALVCAGAMCLTDAVALVYLRGQLMQAAVADQKTAMCAVIGLEAEFVQQACQQASNKGCVSIANYNTPDQFVITGIAKAVDAAAKICQINGAKRCLTLPVSVPSHCDLMQPAAAKLAAALDKITLSPLQIPVVKNIDATCYQSITEIKPALVTQLSVPVLWSKTIAFLQQKGVTNMVECGPNQVLTGLNKRMIQSTPTQPIHKLSQFLNTLGETACLSV